MALQTPSTLSNSDIDTHSTSESVAAASRPAHQWRPGEHVHRYHPGSRDTHREGGRRRTPVSESKQLCRQKLWEQRGAQHPPSEPGLPPVSGRSHRGADGGTEVHEG